MMVEESILDKIRKLLALSTSNNEHEAALAAAKAQEMLLKYNLDISILGEGKVEKAEDISAFYTTLDEVSESGTAWRARLAHTVALGNLCDIVILHGGYGALDQFCWLGKKSNVEIAQYVYGFFESELVRLSEDKWVQVLELKKLQKANPKYQIISLALQGISKDKWKLSFFLGAVAGIREKLEGEKRSLREGNIKMNSLIVYNDEAINRLKGEMYPNLRSMRSTNSIYDAAFSSGKLTGKNLSPTSGISAGGTFATRQLKG